MGKVLGAVLAGGKSTRFGADKAHAVLGADTLLNHAIHALAPYVDTVVVCGRDVPGMTCLVDRPASGLGPLGAINAALHHALEHGFDAVVTTGCDMPRFPAALFEALRGDGPAVLHRQHLAGFWPSTLAGILDDHIATSADRSIYAWIDRAGARIVTVPDLDMPNVNRVRDLEALQAQEAGSSALPRRS